jgi:hypothetical protein
MLLGMTEQSVSNCESAVSQHSLSGWLCRMVVLPSQVLQPVHCRMLLHQLL